MENQTVGSEESARTLAKALGSAENFGPSNRLSCVRDRARLWRAGSRNYQEERKEGGSPRFQEVLLFCTWGAGWIPQEVTTPPPDSFAIRSFPRLNTFGIRQEVAFGSRGRGQRLSRRNIPWEGDPAEQVSWFKQQSVPRVGCDLLEAANPSNLLTLQHQCMEEVRCREMWAKGILEGEVRD